MTGAHAAEPRRHAGAGVRQSRLLRNPPPREPPPSGQLGRPPPQSSLLSDSESHGRRRQPHHDDQRAPFKFGKLASFKLPSKGTRERPLRESRGRRPPSTKRLDSDQAPKSPNLALPAFGPENQTDPFQSWPGCH